MDTLEGSPEHTAGSCWPLMPLPDFCYLKVSDEQRVWLLDICFRQQEAHAMPFSHVLVCLGMRSRHMVVWLGLHS